MPPAEATEEAVPLAEAAEAAEGAEGAEAEAEGAAEAAPAPAPPPPPAVEVAAPEPEAVEEVEPHPLALAPGGSKVAMNYAEAVKVAEMRVVLAEEIAAKQLVSTASKVKGLPAELNASMGGSIKHLLKASRPSTKSQLSLLSPAKKPPMAAPTPMVPIPADVAAVEAPMAAPPMMSGVKTEPFTPLEAQAAIVTAQRPLVWLTGPPLATAPLAAALSAKLGLVLVTPEKALTEGKGGDAHADALAEALRGGHSVGVADGEAAVEVMLVSGEVAVRGAVMVGFDAAHACEHALQTAPTHTLALALDGAELSAASAAVRFEPASLSTFDRGAAGELMPRAGNPPAPPPAEGEQAAPPSLPSEAELLSSVALANTALPSETSLGAVALPGAIPLQGALPAPKLLEAALVAIGHPRPLVPPKAVPLPEEAKELPLAEQLNALRDAALALAAAAGGDGSAVAPSAWGEMCPVSLAKGQLMRGSPLFAAVFLGKLYLMAGASELAAFVANPASAIGKPPPALPPSARLAVVGPPLAGCAAAATALSAQLGGVPILSMASLPAALELKGGPVGERIAAKIAKGLVKDNKRLLADAVAVASGAAPVVTAEDRALVTSEITGAFDKAEKAAPAEGEEVGRATAADVFAAVAAAPPSGTAAAYYSAMEDLFTALVAAEPKGTLSQDEASAIAAFLTESPGADEERARQLALWYGLEATFYSSSSESSSGAGEVPTKELSAALMADAELSAVLLHRLKGAAADATARAALEEAPKALLEALAASGEKIGLVDYLHAASAPALPETAAVPGGFVLDNLPVDAATLTAMTANGVAPQRVVQLVDGSGGEALQTKLAALLEKGDVEAIPKDDDGAALSAETLTAAVAKHAEQMGELKPVLDVAAIPVAEVPIEAATAAVLAAANPFTPAATKLEEPPDEGAMPAFGAGALGETVGYCPVSLAKHGRLVKGKPEAAATFDDKVYLCAGEEELVAFVAAPSEVVGGAAKATPPPPLLLVCGPVGAGADKQAALLAESRKLPLLQLAKLIEAAPLPPSPPPPTEGEEPPPEEEVGPTGRSADEIAQIVADALAAPPAKSEGAVLEWDPAVPLGAAQWEALLKLKIVPDAVANLDLGDDEATKRLFVAAPPPVKKDAEAQLRTEKSLELFDAKVEEEEDPEGPLHAAAADEATKAAAAKPLEAEVAAPEAEDVEERLGTMTEAWQESEEAKKSALAEANAAKKAELEEGHGVLATAAVPLLPLNGEHKPMRLQRALTEAAAPWTSKRSSLFVRAASLEPKDAAKQLDSGAAVLSKFGYHDPVQLLESKTLSAPLIPTEPPPVVKAEGTEEEEAPLEEGEEGEAKKKPTGPEPEGVFAARMRQAIYLFKLASNRDKFVAHPDKYASAPPPPPHVPPKVLVLGGAHAGAPALATKLAARLGATAVTLPEAVEACVAGPSALGRELNSKMLDGSALGSDDVVRALALRLGAPDCLSKGWVLLGAEDETLARGMLAAGLQPHRVFVATLPDAAAEEKAATSSAAAAVRAGTPTVDVAALSTAEIAARRSATPAVLSYFGERGLVVPLDGSKNGWAMYDAAEAETRHVITMHQRYAAAVATGGAAAIGELGVTADEFAAKLGGFGTYCPVTWKRERRLAKSGSGTDARAALEDAAELRGKCYAMAGPAQLAAFLARPTEVLASSVLPTALPRPVPTDEAATEGAEPLVPELQGFCPVSLGRGPKGCDYAARVAALRKGVKERAVEYMGKLFTMANAATEAEFLAAPWRYAALILPAKLPPAAGMVDVGGLPIHGFMEQSANVALQGALNALCELMPKYPTLDAKATALKFIAVHLKAHNPRLRAPHLKHKYGAKLHDFTMDCKLVEKLLEHESRRQQASKMGVCLPESAEYTELLSMWDGIKAKDLNEFIK